MLIKSFKDEDFVNYKKPSMFIITPTCSFKCDKENGCLMCQNSHLVHEPTHDVGVRTLIERYLNNNITQAIVFGGLEPFDTPEELEYFINVLRWNYRCLNDVVIYTGYTEEEVKNMHYTVHYSFGKQDYSYFGEIAKYPNIIIKFGRFRPNEDSHYDSVLGVKLVSSNQYAVRIS